MTMREMAEMLRESIQDERKELEFLIKEIEYIQKRLDNMADVATGIEEHFKGEPTDG